MPQSKNQSSRRTVLVAGVTAAASLAMGQNQQSEPKASAVQAEIDAVNALLAKPLTDEAAKLLVDDVKGLMESTSARLKHPLVENSEPCFFFQARGRDRTTW